MGLDPPTLTTLSPLLHRLAQSQSPRLVLALRPQDLLPDWITHLVLLGPSLRVFTQGPRESVLGDVEILNSSAVYQDYILPKQTANSPRIGSEPIHDQSKSPLRKRPKSTELSREGLPLIDQVTSIANKKTEVLIEMKNVKIKYGEKQVLGGWGQGETSAAKDGLWWTVRRGERWGVFGPNGKYMTSRCIN